MLQRDVRLGDDIDDFCVRCKRVMNHAVVSVVDGAAAKVRCRTCHSDHDFRREQPPPPKVDARKAALFNEVLKTVAPGATPVPLDAEVPEAVDAEIESLEPEELEALEIEAPEPEEQTMVAQEPAADTTTAPKTQAAKSAAKGKAKAKN